jgi:hypothetical protein
MRPKQAFVLISVPLVCYLIFSLSLVSAYRIGELQDAGVKFIIEPVIRIVDDLKPINCESSGYVTFHAYVENVPEFDIKGSEAFVEDVSGEETYNVTSALSCSPKTDLISNQEITCTLNVRELLWNIQTCPFERPENRFYLTLEISYGNRNVRISDEKDFVLTGPGTEPDLEIDFDVSTPSYDIPEINCRTGSEIEVPVVIKHAETFYGDITWSFSVDETGYGGNLIECEKILSREGEGREDIYLCALVISNTVFPECEEGSEVVVGILARTKDHDLSGNFSTSLVSEELNLGLHISEIGTIECQIIDEEGTCVPKEPQQNVTARITGNVPARLKVFENRYKLGDQNITTTYCRKISHEKYECLAFITIDQLPMPADKHSKTTKSRELTLFFDVKYMNYYTSISDSITVTLEGSVINEILNTVNVLEKGKDFFEAIKKISNGLSKVYDWVNTISQCCLLGNILEQLEEGSVKEAVKEFGRLYLWGSAKNSWQKTISILIGNGPALIGCIAEKAMGDIDKEIENLEDFEEGSITSPLDTPNFETVLAQYYPSCRAQNFWDQIKSSWKGWLCAAIFWVTGLGAAICPILTNPVVRGVLTAINLLLVVISLLLLLNTYNEAFKNIALARERINLQLAAENAVGNITINYSEALANTMETLATSLATNTALLNLTYPSYDTIKLLFISDRTGVLDNGDEICVWDSITIEYNFEKLNQTGGFVSKLSIDPNKLGGPLLFNDLEGTYGPIETSTLLGTDPNFDPSEMYTFTLRYDNNNKRLDYDLYYVNHTCI